MDEDRPSEDAEESSPPPAEERRLELPAWVPAAIGLTLVALAGMAAYTGFRTRVKPPVNVGVATPFDQTDGLFIEDGGGPPGSPGPGASKVRPDSDVPSAEAPQGLSEPVVSARRGVMLVVQPPDATIYVNDVEVGNARQFSSPEDAYEFPEEGVFTLRITAPGRDEAVVMISADPEAHEEVAEIELTLAKSR